MSDGSNRTEQIAPLRCRLFGHRSGGDQPDDENGIRLWRWACRRCGRAFVHGGERRG